MRRVNLLMPPPQQVRVTRSGDADTKETPGPPGTGTGRCLALRAIAPRGTLPGTGTGGDQRRRTAAQRGGNCRKAGGRTRSATSTVASFRWPASGTTRTRLVFLRGVCALLGMWGRSLTRGLWVPLSTSLSLANPPGGRASVSCDARGRRLQMPVSPSPVKGPVPPSACRRNRNTRVHSKQRSPFKV